MIEVEVEYRDEISVEVSPDVAFGLVSDIYRSGMHFPAVESLTPVDDEGRWRWQMRERGLGPVKLRATYDAVYTADSGLRTVCWEPPAGGGGDMESSGTWEVVPDGEHCLLRFVARTLAYIPGPRMMSKMVDAFAREELTRLKRQYVAAIAKTLNDAS